MPFRFACIVFTKEDYSLFSKANLNISRINSERALSWDSILVSWTIFRLSYAPAHCHLTRS